MNLYERAILKWWSQFRPVGWTELDHIENPTVNAGFYKTKELSKLAGKIAKSKYNRDDTKKIQRKK